MADIRGTYDASLHQRFRAEQYASYMVLVFEEMSYASTRYFISSNNCTRKNCARFWVKGFKVKVDQDKSRLYLKSARSQVLTNSWLQEAGDMILGLGGHVGIWAAQAWPLGTAFPPLHPCQKSGKLAMFSREYKFGYLCTIFLMLATFFFPKKKKKSGNEISTVMCWNQPSVSAGFYFWPRFGSVVGKERNLIHVGSFTKRLNAYWTCVFPFYL